MSRVRRSMLTVLAAVIMSLPFVGSAAGQQDDAAADVQQLFVQTARSGALRAGDSDGKYTLLLKAVSPRVTVFTDRPVRLTSTLATTEFVKNWDGGTFQSDPPNAALVIADAPESADTFVFELTEPRYDADAATLRYAATLITETPSGSLADLADQVDTKPPAKFSTASLFVDAAAASDDEPSPPDTTTTTAPETTTTTQPAVPTTPTTGASTPQVMSGGECLHSRIIGTITTVTPLTLQSKNVGDVTEEVNALPQNGSGSYRYNAKSCLPIPNDAVVDFVYKVNGTKFTVNGHMKVPAVGANEFSCEIHFGSYVPDNAPWVCIADPGQNGQGGTYDTHPKFSIVEKPETIVSDPDEQVAKLNEYFPFCTAGDDTKCQYTNLLVKEIFKPGEQVENSYSNCLKKDGTHKVTWKKVTKVEDEVGGKGSIGVKVPELVTAQAEAEYKQTVTTEYQFSEEDTLTVEPGRVAAFFFAPGYVEVRGNLRLIDKITIYVLQDVIYRFPLAKGNLVARDLGAASCASPVDSQPQKDSKPIKVRAESS